MVNALTIDVEDYFQVRKGSDFISCRDWEKYASRIEANTYRLLAFLADPSSLIPRPPSFFSPESGIRNPIRATFFCFGWVAKKYPELIKEIHTQGHEIACHGYTHHLIYLLSEKEFINDIRKAKAVLEDIIGVEVIGYRAPCFSITNRSLWALRVIAEEGFRYDSSIFPQRHAAYGLPGAPRFPFMISMNGDSNVKFSPLNIGPEKTMDSSSRTPQSAIRNPKSLWEFPISTVQPVGSTLPISSGGFFEFFPYFILKKGLEKINETEGRPFVLILHPWELDSEYLETKRSGLKLKSLLPGNGDKNKNKIKSLFKEFKFSSLREIMHSPHVCQMVNRKIYNYQLIPIDQY